MVKPLLGGLFFWNSPTPEMQERLRLLIEREKSSQITPLKITELDEYKRIEHLMVLLKVQASPNLPRPQMLHLLTPR